MPIGQPMELYRALKDRGKTTELVFYPREPHGFSEYYHQLDRLRAPARLDHALHARRGREEDEPTVTDSTGSPVAGSPASMNEALTTLFELGREVTSVLDLDELLQKIPQLIARLTHFQAFAVYLLDPRSATS